MDYQRDPYSVVSAVPPVPPEEPDPQQAAHDIQQAMFTQEQRRGPQAASGPDPVRGVEKHAICLLDSYGTHIRPGVNCPHHLPGPDDDAIAGTVRF